MCPLVDAINQGYFFRNKTFMTHTHTHTQKDPRLPWNPIHCNGDVVGPLDRWNSFFSKNCHCQDDFIMMCWHQEPSLALGKEVTEKMEPELETVCCMNCEVDYGWRRMGGNQFQSYWNKILSMGHVFQCRRYQGLWRNSVDSHLVYTSWTNTKIHLLFTLLCILRLFLISKNIQNRIYFQRM